MKNELNTLRVGKHTWFSWGDGWATDIGRYRATTWPFGSIHQSKVFVKYNGDDVGICFQGQKSRLLAMKRGLEWIEAYENSSPITVEQTLKDCYETYPDLYKTRIDVIDHLFFVLGNGYRWLDGALIRLNQDGDLESEIGKKTSSFAISREYREIMKRDLSSNSATMSEEHKFRIRKLLGENVDNLPGPLPDDGKPVFFHAISEHAAISRIPADIKHDWLAFAHEAAILLRDRSGFPDDPAKAEHYRKEYDGERQIERNRAIGARLATELEKQMENAT